MKRNLSLQAVQRCLWMGTVILSALSASAVTQVTFQVDMTAQVIAGTFTNGESLTANGSFNGWGPGLNLTNNPNGANTNLYTGTASDTSDTYALDYKYVAGGTYESTVDGDNRCALLPVGGGTLLLPVSFFDDAGPTINANVTFQVDMSEQISLGNFDTNNGDYVEVHGNFNGWSSGDILTNNPDLVVTNGGGILTSNVYVGTFSIANIATNAPEEYKYVIQPAGGGTYESVASFDADPDTGNRFFIVTNAAETLAIVDFNDKALVTSVTNVVTFEVDMTAQVEVGAFTTNSWVDLSGDFNGWTTSDMMTNNPSGSNPNLWYTNVTIVDVPGATHYFKFISQPGTGWESIANRSLNLLQTNGNLTYGPVYFNNQAPEPFDFIYTTNCMVTFTVNMTNATGTGSGGTASFDNQYPSGDTIYINGLEGGTNNDFWTWGVLSAPSTYQMTQISNTFLFTITLPVNYGQSADLVYKYSINGNDDEAGFADNHERWVRSEPNYTMPVDTYGSQGTNAQQEISFGNLAVSNAGSNQVTISWLGRPGVHLQTTSDLSAAWTNQYLTDATNLIVAPGGAASTNYTTTGNLFYRLVGPQ